jgi:hypothetical protein
VVETHGVPFSKEVSMKADFSFKRFCFVLILCLAFGVVPLWAQGSTYYFPQLVNGASGTSFYTSTFSLSNVLSVTNSVTMRFTKSDGTPWTLDFRSADRGDTGCNCSLTTFILQPGETTTFFTGALGPLVVGWAIVQSSSPLDVSETFVLGAWVGSSSFARWEAGVLPSPTSTRFSFTANKSVSDFLSGVNTNTGLAIANPSGATATVTASLYSRTGTQVSKDAAEDAIVTKTITLPPNAQTALFIDQIFTDYTFSGAFHGTVRLSSNVNVAVVALRDLISTAGDVYSTLAVNPDSTLGYNIVYDTESNDDFSTAQPITQPVRIIGTHNSPTDTTDGDFFSIYLQAGQRLFVFVVADMMGSALDDVVSIYNSGQVVVASNDNFAAPLLDPFVSYAAPAAGLYYIRHDSILGTHGRNSHYEMLVRMK